MTPRARPAALPVARGHLRTGLRGLVAWTLGICAVLGLYLPLYPSMRSDDLTALLDSLPDQLVETLGYDDIATGAGYTQATFFGLMGFVLLSIATIAWGSAAIGGAEEAGDLEIVLAHAVGRVQYALESALALLTRVAALSLVAIGGVLALDGPAQLGLDTGHLVATTAAWAGLGMLTGSAALAAGAATGRSVVAVAAGAAVTVTGYVLNALGRSTPDLAWLRPLSPYHWAFGSDPLTNGAHWPGLGLLWGVSAVLVTAAAWALSHRDIG